MTSVWTWDAHGSGMSGVTGTRERARELARGLLLSREADAVVVEHAELVTGGGEFGGQYVPLARERGVRCWRGVRSRAGRPVTAPRGCRGTACSRTGSGR